MSFWKKTKKYIFPFNLKDGTRDNLPWYYRSINLVVPLAVICGIFGGPLGIAVGALVGASIAFVYSILVELWPQDPPEQAVHTDPNKAEEPQLENPRFPRELYGFCRSFIYSWDVHFFFGAMTGVFLGFLIGSLAGGPIVAGVLAIIGAVIGLANAYYVKRMEIQEQERLASVKALAVANQADDGSNDMTEVYDPSKDNSAKPTLGQSLIPNSAKSNDTNTEQVETPPTTLLGPSKHDVPATFRAGFMGTLAGSNIHLHVARGEATSSIHPLSAAEAHGSPEHTIGVSGGLVGAFLAFFEPYINKAVHWVLLQFFSQEQINNFEKKFSQTNKDGNLWFKESSWDVPLSSRLFVGIMMGVIIGSAVFPGLGTLAGIVISCLVTVISPYAFALARYSVGNDDGSLNSRKLKISLFAGVIAGAMVAAALFPIAGPLAFVAIPAVMALFAALPHIINAIDRFGKDCESKFGPHTSKLHNINLPWYARVLVGLMTGALLTTALGLVGVAAFAPLSIATIATIIAITAVSAAAPMLHYFMHKVPYLRDALTWIEERAPQDSFFPFFKRIVPAAIVGGVLGGALSYLGFGGVIVLSIGSAIPVVGQIALAIGIGCLIGAGLAYVWPMIWAAIRTAIHPVAKSEVDSSSDSDVHVHAALGTGGIFGYSDSHATATTALLSNGVSPVTYGGEAGTLAAPISVVHPSEPYGAAVEVDTTAVEGSDKASSTSEYVPPPVGTPAFIKSMLAGDMSGAGAPPLSTLRFDESDSTASLVANRGGSDSPLAGQPVPATAVTIPVDPISPSFTAISPGSSAH